MAYVYETVIILNPILSDDQAKDVVAKFRKIINDLGGKITQEEGWGKKSGGHYHLFDFTGDARVKNELENALKRDERVLRFMTTRLEMLDATDEAPSG